MSILVIVYVVVTLAVVIGLVPYDPARDQPVRLLLVALAWPVIVGAVGVIMIVTTVVLVTILIFGVGPRDPA